MNKVRQSYLLALGGKCIRCGDADLSHLEVHAVDASHRGYDNKQRLKDLADYSAYHLIHPNRILLCWRCHHYGMHGSEAATVGERRRAEMRKQGLNVAMRYCTYQELKVMCDGNCAVCPVTQEAWK